MKKLYMLLFMFLLIAPRVKAQDSTVRANVFAAGSFISGERSFTSSSGVFRTDYSKGGKIGAGVAVDLNDHWAGEGSYAFGRNSLRVNRLDAPRPVRTFQTSLHQFTADGSYYFLPSGERWRPFLTAGLTLTRFSPTNEGASRAAQNLFELPTRISSSTKLGFNFGGGVEVPVNDSFGIRLALRNHVMGLPRFGLPEKPLNPGGVSYPVSGIIQNLEVALGVVFYVR